MVDRKRNRRRLPPPSGASGPLYGRTVRQFTVCSWTPTPDGSGPPVAVAIDIELVDGEHFVLRMKSAAAVDDTIQALLRHKRHVWPDAP